MSATKRLPTYLAPRGKSSACHVDFLHIPKKIFHTWETSEVPFDLYDAAYTWIEKNPDWEYHFFDNARCREFIRDHFPARVLAAYDQLIPGAYRADLWRYCVLYVNGGVYADLKLPLLNSLDQLLRVDTQFTTVNELAGSARNKGALYQAFICCKPEHSFLQAAVNIVVDNVENKYFGKNSLYPTGPKALGRAINLTLNRRVEHRFLVGTQQINGFEFTLWNLSKKNPYSLSPLIRTIFTDSHLKNPCFHQAYIGYFSLKTGDKNYVHCWYNGRIYKDGINLRNYLGPVICQARQLYRDNKKAAARKLLLQRLKHMDISLLFFEVLIDYEILKPCVKLLKRLAVLGRMFNAD